MILSTVESKLHGDILEYQHKHAYFSLSDRKSVHCPQKLKLKYEKCSSYVPMQKLIILRKVKSSLLIFLFSLLKAQFKLFRLKF